MPTFQAAGGSGPDAGLPLLLCLSHLRWDFVFQRPHHVLSRAVRQYRVFFLEEPVFAGVRDAARLQVRISPEGVMVATPSLPAGLDDAQMEAAQSALIDGLLIELGQQPAVLWYYTPMALTVAGHLAAAVTVYDCMDELSLFRGASLRLHALERQLLSRADLVFCGGRSLYEAKRLLHPSVHLFPSSVDVAHFSPARGGGLANPADQAGLGRPRIGYFGVIDERIDLGLLATVCAMRPDWQVVMLGPLAKLDAAALPVGTNLHWLGAKRYSELPAYLAHWDAGFMPFALNEATRFISPTKTPEFLAAGLPVVSTPVADVVRDWGGLVRVGEGPAAVVAALDAALSQSRGTWLAGVDRRLARSSWDATWAGMTAAVGACLAPRRRAVARAANSKGAAHV